MEETRKIVRAISLCSALDCSANQYARQELR